MKPAVSLVESRTDESELPWAAATSNSEVVLPLGVLTLLPTPTPAYSQDPSLRRRRQWHPTPVLLPRKSHGRRSLVGCSPWGREESDTTERLHFHFSLSHFGEGNGNPLQCSCLENPRNGGAWWAAVYGVAQSRTRLERLSSSSSSSSHGSQREGGVPGFGPESHLIIT